MWNKATINLSLLAVKDRAGRPISVAVFGGISAESSAPHTSEFAPLLPLCLHTFLLFHLSSESDPRTV